MLILRPSATRNPSSPPDSIPPPPKANPKAALGRLSALGIGSPRDAAFLLPKGYIDLREGRVKDDFSLLEDGASVVLRCSGMSGLQTFLDGRPPRTVFTVHDRHGAADVSVTVFGDARPLMDRIKGPGPFFLRGEAAEWNGRPQLKSPHFVDPAWVGRVQPVYPGKPKVITPEMAARRLAALLPEAIPLAAAWLEERLGWGARERSAFLSSVPGRRREYGGLAEVLREAHRPASPESGAGAALFLRRLATLDVLATAAAAARREAAPGCRIAVPDSLLDELLSGLPLRPTDEQRAAMREICEDLGRDRPMLRLLSADVGMGKTFTAGAVCAAVATLGGRVVWLSPNQPLAVQTRDAIAGWWPDLAPGLVLGDARGVPDSRILVGTTALLHRLPQGSAPALLVVDEEQKFGTGQKDGLAGPETHVLKATATCIPRTAALLQYGGMSVSRLSTPHVKKTIETRIVAAEHRARLFEAVRHTVRAGHQALVIYPLAECAAAEGEADRKSAEGAAALWERHFPGRVRFMHGRLPNAEKLAAIAALRAGEADLLVSTIAVETGIDLPRLRHVVVVHPERLGVNTLHQIRGRVARQGGKGYCHLFLPAPVKAESLARLAILVRHADGFDVARENMRMQGFGEVGGAAQSGKSPSFLPGHSLGQGDVEWVAENWLPEPARPGKEPVRPDDGEDLQNSPR